MPAKDELIRGYAQALFAVAEAEGGLAVVEDELYAFAKAVESNTKLREALTDASLPIENKRALIADVLGGANPHTANLVSFLVEQGRARETVKIMEELARIAAERRDHVVAEVRSAVPIDDRRRTRLATALSTATGRKVEVKVVIDPSVIGGAVTTVGDEVFDGTVRTRLEEARELLGSR